MKNYENFNSIFDVNNIFSFLESFNTTDIKVSDNKINISENKDFYEVEILTPGYSKDELKISIEDNILKISGEKIEKESEEKNSEKNYFVKEFDLKKKFERKFKIYNNKIDTEKIDASLNNGILKILLYKKEGLTKKIDIS